MSSHLNTILAATREAVGQRKAMTSMEQLHLAAASHTPRGFARALRAHDIAGIAIIAELKKASPSRGLIRGQFDIPALSRAFQQGGAAALSVLTEEKFFLGSLENLEAASATVNLPCLRKDFIVDEWQIVEARAHKADAILLIAAALCDDELKTLRAAAKVNGIDVLCEVHSEEELARVTHLGCEAIGVNSRDLKTLEVDLNTALRIGPLLPKDAVRVAESGIRGAQDIDRLMQAGYDAFLVGESLMRQTDPGQALAELISDVARISGSTPAFSAPVSA